jgi:hypothetical protein
LKPTENFKSKLKILDHEAYFKKEDERADQVVDQVEVTPVEDIIIVPSPKVTPAKKKTAKKTVKKKAP